VNGFVDAILNERCLVARAIHIDGCLVKKNKNTWTLISDLQLSRRPKGVDQLLPRAFLSSVPLACRSGPAFNCSTDQLPNSVSPVARSSSLLWRAGHPPYPQLTHR